MTFRLSQDAIEGGYRLEAHASVGSTNALALDRARQGDAGRLWVVAGRQESGRGRRGRPWATPEGNLAATLLLAGSVDLRNAATLGFVAGIALGDALQHVAPEARVTVAADGVEAGKGGEGGRNAFRLKWPNDVLAGGAKLAGILLESCVLSSGRSAVAVGIGVNVASHPADTPYPATSLAALGCACDASALFSALSQTWLAAAALWDEGRGLDAVRRRWLEQAAGLGAEVAVRVDGTVTRGIFETIDEECRFVIRARDGASIPIAAGDVHFGAVASAAAGQSGAAHG